MGDRGPIGKPTALKELEGNPGKRPLNKNEPQYRAVQSAPPPKWFTREKKNYWSRAVSLLSAARLLTEGDLFVLERYCEFLAQFKECREFLDEKQATTYEVFGKFGDLIAVKPYPQAARMLRISDHLLKIETHFGMTPAARSRVTTIGGADDGGQNDDPFGEH